MTEPEAGSAVTDLQTTATPKARAIRVNGSKIFTTHSTHADVILTYVRFGPGVGGIGSVLIDTKAKGVRFGKRSKFMSGGRVGADLLRERPRTRRDGGGSRKAGSRSRSPGSTSSASQRGALARARLLRLRGGETVGDAEEAIRAPLCEFQACSGNSPR